MPSKTVFFFIAIIIVVGGVIYFTKLPTNAPTINTNNSENAEVPSSNMPVPGSNVDEMIVNTDPNTSTGNDSTNTPLDNTAPSVKTFAVTGTPFNFSVTEMRVKKGDTVKVVFTNAQGFHNWVVDEFNARTPQIGAGQTSTIEFVADKTGTFEYYCSVGSHRAQGMKGNLIVE